MPLGTEVGLGPDDIVLVGDPAPHKKGHSPQFSVHIGCYQTAVCIRLPLGMEVGLSPDDFLLNRDAVPSQKGGGAPAPIFGPYVYCGQTAASIIMPLCTEVGLGPNGIVLDGAQLTSLKRPSAPPNFRPISIVAKPLDGSKWHLARRWALIQGTSF